MRHLATQITTPQNGERLIPATAYLYPPAIEQNDLLLVNFHCHAVEYGALYLVEEMNAGKVSWVGCRRLDRQPGNTRIDLTGRGDWQDIDLHAVCWRIAGEVRQVFKPSI